MELVLDSRVNSGVTTNTYRHPHTEREVLTITGEDNKIICMVAYLFNKEDTVFTLMKEFGVTTFEAFGADISSIEVPGKKNELRRIEHNYNDKKETPLEGLALFRQMIKIHIIDPNDKNALAQAASIVQVLKDEKDKL